MHGLKVADICCEKTENVSAELQVIFTMLNDILVPNFGAVHTQNYSHNNRHELLWPLNSNEVKRGRALRIFMSQFNTLSNNRKAMIELKIK